MEAEFAVCSNPGYIGSPDVSRSSYSPSPSRGFVNVPEPTSQPRPDTRRLLQLSEWKEEKAYDEEPPSCIHFVIKSRVTINNRVVTKDTTSFWLLVPTGSCS